MLARRMGVERAFRSAADQAAALEARLDAECREQYRRFREQQETTLRRVTERRDQARAAYEAERRKHRLDRRLDMLDRSSTSPAQLRAAARTFAARDRFVAQCRLAQERNRVRFLRGTLAAQEARRAFARSADRPTSRDARSPSTPDTRPGAQSETRSAPDLDTAPACTAEERREAARQRLARAWEQHARETRRIRGYE